MPLFVPWGVPQEEAEERSGRRRDERTRTLTMMTVGWSERARREGF